MNLNHLIQYAADRDEEQKQRLEAKRAIDHAELVLSRTRDIRYEIDNADLTRIVIELAKRVVALEEKLGVEVE